MSAPAISDAQWADLRAAAREVPRPVIAIVMGVSSSGKTTIAANLARALDCPFQDGDDLHPPENVAKMKAGTPLTDTDRAPWLARIAALVDTWRAANHSGVIACSALKRAYRDIIIGDRPGVALVCLKGDFDTIRDRMAARHDHYMPLALLESQFAALEPPTLDERPIAVDITDTPAANIAAILRQLNARSAP